MAGVGMFLALKSSSEVEGDLNAALRALVTRQLRSKESVADGARGWHGARLHAVHLLAGRALEELPGRAVDELLETGAVVGVAALGQGQGARVIVSQADGALISVSSTSSPGQGVGTDQVTSAGPGYGLLVRWGWSEAGPWTWLVTTGLVPGSSLLGRLERLEGVYVHHVVVLANKLSQPMVGRVVEELRICGREISLDLQGATSNSDTVA